MRLLLSHFENLLQLCKQFSLVENKLVTLSQVHVHALVLRHMHVHLHLQQQDALSSNATPNCTKHG